MFDMKREYVYQREMTYPVEEFRFDVCNAPDGRAYAVFLDCEERYQFDLVHTYVFAECSVTSFGALNNAFCLGRLH